MFESGAIVLHIGERSDVLLPEEPKARAPATRWLIAALNSIEPHVMNVAAIDLLYADQEWAILRRPGAEAFVRHRLGSLSNSVGDEPYLDGDRFTAGDLMMSMVLRILHHTDIVTSDRRLAAYVEGAAHGQHSGAPSTPRSEIFRRRHNPNERRPDGAPMISERTHHAHNEFFSS
jgi:glutathione S-transferase